MVLSFHRLQFAAHPGPVIQCNVLLPTCLVCVARSSCRQAQEFPSEREAGYVAEGRISHRDISAYHGAIVFPCSTTALRHIQMRCARPASPIVLQTAWRENIRKTPRQTSLNADRRRSNKQRSALGRLFSARRAKRAEMHVDTKNGDEN